MLSPAAPGPVALPIYLLSAERTAGLACFEAKLAECHSDSHISQEKKKEEKKGVPAQYFCCDVTRFERADL